MPEDDGLGVLATYILHTMQCCELMTFRPKLAKQHHGLLLYSVNSRWEVGTKHTYNIGEAGVWRSRPSLASTTPPPSWCAPYASTLSPGVMENPLARAGGVMMPAVAAVRILSLVAGSGALVNVSPSVRRQATTHGWAQQPKSRQKTNSKKFVKLTGVILIPATI